MWLGCAWLGTGGRRGGGQNEGYGWEREGGEEGVRMRAMAGEGREEGGRI